MFLQSAGRVAVLAWLEKAFPPAPMPVFKAEDDGDGMPHICNYDLINCSLVRGHASMEVKLLYSGFMACFLNVFFTST